jgi:hypothetical protein
MTHRRDVLRAGVPRAGVRRRILLRQRSVPNATGGGYRDQIRTGMFVYDGRGSLVGQIDVPERPVQLLFGGADRRTLFILTHHAVYAVTTRAAGEATAWSAAGKE